MNILSLNGDWELFQNPSEEPVQAVVPGSVLTDLSREQKIDDPYYRTNETIARELAYRTYTYRRNFMLDEIFYHAKELTLCCNGLDTLAKIMLNGRLVSKTDNMHLGYRFDVKPYCQLGENTIEIIFDSPLQYIEEQRDQGDIHFAVEGGTDGSAYIRKTHSSFGWDWGPQIPDAGIWQEIWIEATEEGRIAEIHVEQFHHHGQVSLQIHPSLVTYDVGLFVKIRLLDPQGNPIVELDKKTDNIDHIVIPIDKPQLWWPNSIGNQPLYTLSVSLWKETKKIDEVKKRLGLRTISIRQNQDRLGQEFTFLVNGKEVFMMGANFIPEDSLLGRLGEQRSRRLIDDCIFANFNMLRIWGGGYYPPDYFYDYCDERGILIWQDFMFACNVYDLTDAFADSITKEAIYQVKRLRDHACLAIWCGNNENEMGWADWNFESVSSAKHKEEYLVQFEEILKNVVSEYDPSRFYWPSSPSSGGGLIDTLAENKGDTHYWDVWAQDAPILEYRNHLIRFCTEFGFQSFPCKKTVETFTLPDDRFLDSPVMLAHQKRPGSNERILRYLKEQYGQPKDFDALLYGSQLMQADAIRCAVEHFRRNRGDCMGALYWQLNDCWPVASWSSIDYFGRYKALHYAAKRFYAPIAVSSVEDNGHLTISIAYEGVTEFQGELHWQLRDNRSSILKEGQIPVTCCGSGVLHLPTLDFTKEIAYNPNSCYVSYSLMDKEKEVSAGTSLFCLDKDFLYLDPALSWSIMENANDFTLQITSKAFAKGVYLDLKQADCIFDDNWFDLHAGETKTINVEKHPFAAGLTKELLQTELTAVSVYQMNH